MVKFHMTEHRVSVEFRFLASVPDCLLSRYCCRLTYAMQVKAKASRPQVGLSAKW